MYKSANRYNIAFTLILLYGNIIFSILNRRILSDGKHINITGKSTHKTLVAIYGIT